jgi:imidazole glycerol phosphate synthase subunit HisF
MRIGASFILQDGYCFQSYNWKFFRPLGTIDSVVRFLDRYQVDEICITRPIRRGESKDNFLHDINKIKSTLSNSPITLGGGLRTIQHLKDIHDLPIERLHFSHAFLHKRHNVINRAINLYGKQAIVAVMPLMIKDHCLFIYDGLTESFRQLTPRTLDFIAEHADEVIVIDTLNEGNNEHFNFEILKLLPLPTNQLIITGGVGPSVTKQARALGISSCLIENRILHNENYIKTEL